MPLHTSSRPSAGLHAPTRRVPASLHASAQRVLVQSPPHRPWATRHIAHLGFSLAAVWVAVVFLLIRAGV